MMEVLRRLWPVLPALAIAWFAGASFVEKYPRRIEGPRRGATASGPDTLMAQFRQELAEDSLAAAPARQSDNFFRPIRPPRPVADGRPAMAMPPPPRRFLLNGTVGRSVATITDNSGRKRIVKVGDVMDSSEVLSIEPNKVILKDRSGRFELLMEN